MAVSALVLGERMTAAEATGALIVLVGLALTVLKPKSDANRQA
jgi:drug/metabolite transporter (DMT)-like permease